MGGDLRGIGRTGSKAPSATKKASPKNSRDDIRGLVEITSVGLFGALAVATGHAHWAKDVSELQPMTDPLVRIIEQMPPKQLKSIEKYLNPLLFVGGCAVVVGPDLGEELRLRRAEAEERRKEQQQRNTRGLPAAQARNGNGANASQYPAQGADAGSNVIPIPIELAVSPDG